MNTTALSNGNGSPSLSYPIFAPNQVLSDRDLNQVVKYLDNQNRLTRTHLIGMGIACGLEVSSTFQASPSIEATIQILPGCGITSEGYLIALPKTMLTHYRDQQLVKTTLFTPDPNQITTQTPASQASADLKQYEVMELFSEKGYNTDRLALHEVVKDNPTEDAFEQFLENRVLVVLYELENRQRDACLLDCDNLGSDRNFRLRYFLLPRSSSGDDANNSKPKPLSAEMLLKQGYPTDHLPEPWKNDRFEEIWNVRQSFLRTYYPRVQRFGYVEEDDENSQKVSAIRLSTINDYSVFLQRYYAVCQKTIDTIGETVPFLSQLFSPFFSSFQPNDQDFKKLKERLTEQLNRIVPASIRGPETNATETEQTEVQYALQYFYDYLSQLVAAYRELAETAFDLMDDCVPDLRRFPRHLMLGKVAPPNQPPQAYAVPSPDRSHFTQPPLYNSNSHRIKQVRHLYDRLLRLCAEDGFYLLPFYDTPLKITPSKDRSVGLSEQAIPYYLNYPKLYHYWNYDNDRKGRSECHPAYFYPLNTSPNIPTCKTDLVHRLDDYEFYRVEGHIGKDKRTMLDRIREYRQRWNLAFDIVTAKIGDRVDPDDADTLEELDKSGQLDALKNDFEGVKDIFQKIWEINKNQENWSTNVFLSTLKHVFFDQSKISDITLDQLYNPILVAVRSDTDEDVYEFEPEQDENNQPTKKYRLFIRNLNAAGEGRLARFTFEAEQNSTTDLLDLSGLSDEAISQEQRRISNLLSKALRAERFTYSVDHEANSERFYVCLAILDKFDLPIHSSTNTTGESVAVKLISLTYFTINRTGEQPLIEQKEFQNFETLYGLLRDLPDDNAELNEMSLRGNHSAAIDYINAFNLKERIEAYTRLTGQMTTPHLFSHFAQYHPGMEHLGGVPNGGTLILAYTDDSELAGSLLAIYRSSEHKSRTNEVKKSVSLPTAASGELESIQQDFLTWKNIIVADYCLPYRCWDNTIASCHEHLPLRPIILLEKTDFCAEDQDLYEFLLHPINGNLKGEGSFFSQGKYYFQPSRVQSSTTHDSTIIFTYIVNSCESVFVVTVHPLPNVYFKFGESDKTEFCADDEPIALIPRISAGTFRAFDGEQDVSSNLIQDNQFLPSKVDLEETNEKTITLTYEVTSKYGCTNHIERNITIHELPNPEFQVDDGETTSFYADIASVALTPNQPNGVFRALDGSRDISARVIQDDRFLPSAVSLGQAPEKVITLEYTVTSDKGCTNRATKDITILAPSLVEALNLVQLDNSDGNDDIPAVPRSERHLTFPIRLTGDRTFRLSEFDSDRRYTFDALTIPETVDGVIFTYTPPGRQEPERPTEVTTSPYQMPDGWQPRIGIHKIKAVPFRNSGRKKVMGKALTVTINITNEDDRNDTIGGGSGSGRLLNRLQTLLPIHPLNEEGGISNLSLRRSLHRNALFTVDTHDQVMEQVTEQIPELILHDTSQHSTPYSVQPIASSRSQHHTLQTVQLDDVKVVNDTGNDSGNNSGNNSESNSESNSDTNLEINSTDTLDDSINNRKNDITSEKTSNLSVFGSPPISNLESPLNSHSSLPSDNNYPNQNANHLLDRLVNQKKSDRSVEETGPKLSPILAFSAAMLLFILGWAYSSSRQLENSTNPSSPSISIPRSRD